MALGALSTLKFQVAGDVCDTSYERSLNSLYFFVIIYVLITLTIECSNEILGWEGVGNRQLLCFFKA
jgi:hypothetical protein